MGVGVGEGVGETYGTWCRTAVCSGSAFPTESSYGVWVWVWVRVWVRLTEHGVELLCVQVLHSPLSFHTVCGCGCG